MNRTLLLAGVGAVVVVPLLALVPLVVVLAATSGRAAVCAPPSVSAAGAPGSTAAGQAAVPAEYAPLVAQAAATQQVAPAWLAAVLQTESSWNPQATSPAGAQGLAQLLPGTAAQLGVTDPFDPGQSIDGGAEYLGVQHREFGTWELAAAAYNAGPGAVRRHGGVPPYPETQDYVRAVSALAQDFGAAGGGGLLACPPGVGGGPRIVGDTACPIGEPHHFTDTWGAPRSGGRSHKGVDIFADSGIPLYAYTAGTVRLTSSSLGGVSLWVTTDAGDAFYYAHLSRYAPGLTGGAPVEAGQLIGFNGNTGNARTTPAHLHWEVHPGGGDAVNPTPYAQAACAP